MIDARRMEVFSAQYDANLNCIQPVAAEIITEESYKDREDTIHFIGDGAPKCKELLNKSNFILWNNKMETIKIDKVGSQIDVLPTLYNLFGVKYDSRLIIGKDILSTEPGLAIFGNRSWVSDKGKYFSQSKKFVPNESVDVSNDYITYMNSVVNNRMSMSKNIMVNNYYKKVLGD